MKITIDKKHGLTYIYLSDKKIKGTKSEGNYYIDIAEDGTIVGIEYLNEPEIVYTENLNE
jgi:uncharacterized protein YuzE